MSLSALLILYAAWCLFRGAGFILFPAKLWSTFNVHLDKHTAFPVQLLGGAFLATAVLSWAAKDLVDDSAKECILLFIVCMEVIQALLTLYGLYRHAVVRQAMGPFIIHVLFAIGFAYFLF